jgi:hypothetical protein
MTLALSGHERASELIITPNSIRVNTPEFFKHARNLEVLGHNGEVVAGTLQTWHLSTARV